MSNKIHTFDEALEYIKKYKEADRSGYHDRPMLEEFPDEFGIPDELDDAIPDGDFDDALKSAIEYMSQMMDNFVHKMIMEIDDIIENEGDELDRVLLETEVMEKKTALTRIKTLGSYKDFTYETFVLIPTNDWENERKEVKLWMRAFILREYKIQKGQL